MTSGHPSPRRQPRAKVAFACLAASLVSPLVVFGAILAMKAGVVDRETAFGLLTLKVAFGLAWVGAAVALFGLWRALPVLNRLWLPGLISVAVAAITLGLFLHYFAREGAATGGGDVSTDKAETPGFSTEILARRTADNAVPLAASRDAGGCEVAFVPGQAAPQVAAYALKTAGFDVRAAGVGRADGTHESFWFGYRYDAVVRIRPDRTDIRVAARIPRHDAGEACRLAQAVAAEIRDYA